MNRTDISSPSNRRPLRHLLLGTLALTLCAPTAVLAHDKDDGKLRAVPFAFVGTASQCAPSPRGANIITSAWLGGMGLPDDGSLNGGPSPKDPHTGLLLNKNGLTSECAAAGATIEGFKRGSTITELGFDYRNGGHCGAGAPRFNITTTAGATFFAGCAAGTPSPAPQDPLEWTRIRINTTAQVFPAGFIFGPTGTRVKSITIIHDEGTDSATNDTQGVGLAVIDNIDIDGKLIRSGRGIEPRPHGGHDDDDDHDD